MSFNLTNSWCIHTTKYHKKEKIITDTCNCLDESQYIMLNERPNLKDKFIISDDFVVTL